MAMIFRNANLPELLLHIIVQKINVHKTKQIWSSLFLDLLQFYSIFKIEVEAFIFTVEVQLRNTINTN